MTRAKRLTNSSQKISKTFIITDSNNHNYKNQTDKPSNKVNK